MSCYYPVSAWRSATLNESGKRGIVFSPKDGFRDQPFQVPCGKCIGCRADQALMWSIRGYHESTLHEQNSFLTLTYSDDNLPSDGKIVKDDLQRFFKRLRKHGKFRYLACGEYGELTRRPHYHAVIFGQDFLGDAVSINEQLYSSDFLVDCWGLGHVSCAPVTMASICYVCGYVNKKMHDQDTFSLMSRRPGIGKDWLVKYKDDLVRTGQVTIENRTYPVPSRYLQWFEDDFAALKLQRKKIAQSGDSLAKVEALAHKEANRLANLKRKKETL